MRSTSAIIGLCLAAGSGALLAASLPAMPMPPCTRLNGPAMIMAPRSMADCASLSPAPTPVRSWPTTS